MHKWCRGCFCAAVDLASYVPVSKKGYWQIEMDSVDVAGDSVTSVTSAILDSGTSLLVGPSEDVKEIASKVVRACVRVCVRATVSCSWRVRAVASLSRYKVLFFVLLKKRVSPLTIILAHACTFAGILAERVS